MRMEIVNIQIYNTTEIKGDYIYSKEFEKWKWINNVSITLTEIYPMLIKHVNGM